MEVDDQQIAAIEKEHHGDPNKCCNAVLCRGFQTGEGISWEQVIQCIFNIHRFCGDSQVSNPEKLLHESTGKDYKFIVGMQYIVKKLMTKNKIKLSFYCIE